MAQDWLRRDFIKQMAGMGLTLPVLPSLGSAGVAKSSPKRFIVVFTGSGQFAPHWYPDPRVNLHPISERARGCRLSDIPDAISSVLGPKFNKFRDKLNLIRGLDIVPSCGIAAHTASKMLDGFGSLGSQHMTIDQIMARSPRVYPSPPVISSLYFMVRGSGNTTSLSCGNDGWPITPYENPYLAEMRILHQSFPKPELWKFLKSRYSAAINNLDLSPDDRTRLQGYLATLNSFTTLPQSCKIPVLEPIGELSDKVLIERFVKIIDVAVKCDLTRVITFAMTQPEDNKTMPYIPGSPSFHELTHNVNNPRAIEQLLMVQQFHADQFLSLLERLDVVEDSATGATYLDNSVVLWIGEQSVRPNDHIFPNTHGSDDLPVLMAGSLGGFFKTGQYINFQKPGVKKGMIYLPNSDGPRLDCKVQEPCYFTEDYPDIGIPVNELLVTLMTGMGLIPSEWEKAGESGFGNYDGNFNNQYNLSDRRRLISEIVA